MEAGTEVAVETGTEVAVAPFARYGKALVHLRLEGEGIAPLLAGKARHLEPSFLAMSGLGLARPRFARDR